jgi:hypothetical protein
MATAKTVRVGNVDVECSAEPGRVSAVFRDIPTLDPGKTQTVMMDMTPKQSETLGALFVALARVSKEG